MNLRKIKFEILRAYFSFNSFGNSTVVSSALISSAYKKNRTSRNEYPTAKNHSHYYLELDQLKEYHHL